ncbi:MAG: GTPase Era [Cyclobacteriaceae bacterium]|nr:GTPase Era [Cyclobacteriaceae bacterium]
MEKPHRAGFVSIIGKPNAGKSTLMNRLMGEKLSIITRKAQTTRHRIMGIISGEDFQIVYSDTPGILKPEYKLHESMMAFVNTSLEDADVILLLIELGEKYDEDIHNRLKNIEVPIILIINKTDLAVGSQLHDKMEYWKGILPATEYHSLSALTGEGVSELVDKISQRLPEHPAYFAKDAISDKPERFFASEIIREKIFMNYKKEVPYSTEVEIVDFLEEEDIIRMRAEIYVERKSQKGILIGKGGAALKKVGIEARKDLEDFFGKHVHIETFVKVSENWRKSDESLKKFGY